MDDTTRGPHTRPRLYVEANVAEADAVAGLVAAEGVGAVFATDNLTKAAQALAVVRTRAAHAAVMLDADQYSGANSKPARAGVDQAWIDGQRRLGLKRQLTNSGYVTEDDIVGLQTLLHSARGLEGNVAVVLPLSPAWWADGPRQRLIEEVTECGLDVGLVLEHAKDPFSVIGTVRGVVDFVQQVPVKVLTLRTDLSGLGVIEFGGSAAAIGTRSSLRHLYPVGSGGFGKASVSALWVRGLCYRTIEKLTDAIAADPDALHWKCDCSACYGRSIEWIVFSRTPEIDAFRHSVASLRTIHDALRSGARTPAEHQRGWIELCRIAQSYSWEVAGQSGRSWEPPTALGAWNRAIPARVTP